jgi:hypothetical protein
MKVLLNDKEGGRVAVEAVLVEDRVHTVRVRLPDGNIITSNKKRDVEPCYSDGEGI